MLVIVNPYHRSVTIDGEEVVQKILEFPNKLNYLSTISCTYDSEEQKITKVHDLHRFTSNFIQREYFFEHLPEFVEWFYAEKQAQIEEEERLQKYKEDVENAVNQTVQAGIDAQANITTDKTNAINAIESAHTTATNSITSKRAEALNAIQDAKAESLNTITETTNNSVSSVTGAMNTALNNISTERIAAINNISNDKAEALSAIATDRRSSLDEINNSINKATAQADRSKTEADRSKYYADQVSAITDARPATKDQIGLVIVGDNLEVDNLGTIKVPTPTLATTDEEGNPVEAKAGVVKIGKGLEVEDDGTVNVVTASADKVGGIKLGDGFSLDENGKVNVAGMSIATHEAVGISKPSTDMTIDAEGTLTDKREFLYYDKPNDVPESGLPKENVKAGAMAFINDGNFGSTLGKIADEVVKRLSIEPIGKLDLFAHNNIPEGWLICDGTEISRNTFSALFAKIGTLYGEGDGSTTFNVPDFNNRFIEGSLTAGEVKEAGLPNITGSVSEFPLGATSGAFVYNSTSYGQRGSGAGGVGRADFSASLSNPIYGKSNTVQPASITIVICIKAFNTVQDADNLSISNLIHDMALLRKAILPEFTDERVVGTLNGKPVYEKVISAKTPTTVNTIVKVADVSELNLDILLFKCSAILTTDSNYVSIPYTDSTSKSILTWWIAKKVSINMVVETNSIAYLNRDCNITLRYTKTTD